LETKKYIEQIKNWPTEGKHILANYNQKEISVYQAYGKEIASYAVKNQKFGGNFGYSRMSWIKPNFLWMMYRSGWATKVGQEHILEIIISRIFFFLFLEKAVISAFDPDIFEIKDDWDKAIELSEVRLQWDPDHTPEGNKTIRRAIQLGLRGKMLKRYGQDEILKINDITDFVIIQRDNMQKSIDELILPIEEIYVPINKNAIKNIHLDFFEEKI
jgi:hypothetical protein